MKKEVIFVLLDQFADWECAFLTSSINIGTDFQPQETAYIAKTLSIDGKPVRSIGGLCVTPDYSLATLPDDFAAIILVGGLQWFEDKTKLLLPLIEKAVEKNVLVAAICNATVFLAMHGLLNHVKHTSNLPEFLQQYGQENYTGETNYLYQPSVVDKNIITANGTASLEFTRDVLLALEFDKPVNIEKYYRIYKLGFYEAGLNKEH